MRRRTNSTAAFSLFSFQDIITSVMGIVLLVMLVVALELAGRQMATPAVQQTLVRQDVREAIASAHTRIAELRKSIEVGDWQDLAGLSASEIAREQASLVVSLPLLEADLAEARRHGQKASERRSAAESELQTRATESQELDLVKEEVNAMEEQLAKMKSTNARFYRLSAASGKQPWLVEVSGASLVVAPLGPSAPPIDFPGSNTESRVRQFLAWTTEREATRDYFVLLIKPGGTKVGSDLERRLREQGFNIGLDLVGSRTTAIDAAVGAPIEPVKQEPTP